MIEETLFIKPVQSSRNLDPQVRKQIIYNMTKIVSKLTKLDRFPSFYGKENNQKLNGRHPKKENLRKNFGTVVRTAFYVSRETFPEKFFEKLQFSIFSDFERKPF